MGKSLEIIGMISVVFIAVEAMRMAWFGLLAKIDGKKTIPFSIISKVEKKIVVFGDSMAVGVGVRQPEFSVAGRVSKIFPGFSVKNYAVSGTGTRELMLELEKRAKVEASLTIISIGGIDIIKLRSLRKIENRLDYILKNSAKISQGKVVIFLSQNIHMMPFFRFPLNIIIARRYQKVRKIYTKLAAEHRIIFVDLFEYSSMWPFKRKINKELFSRDRIHPNEKGYDFWFEKLHSEIISRGWKDEIMNK